MSKKIDVSAGPSMEPVEVDEAKLFLRIDGSDEDDLIAALITAARMNVERYLNLSLITQDRTQTIVDAEAVTSFQLVQPLQSVTSIKTVDEAGVETTVSESDYTVQNAPGRVVLRSTATPLTAIGGAKIVIEYSSGYGTGSPVSSEDVPKGIKQGILHSVAHGYEHRESADEIPPTALLFLNPFREIPL